jgi:hypothetical protein
VAAAAGVPVVATRVARLALAGSSTAEVVVEPIVAGAEAEIGKIVRGERRTASAIDRSAEPPFGRSPSLKAPAVWRAALSNGLPVLGIEDRDTLVVRAMRSQAGLVAMLRALLVPRSLFAAWLPAPVPPVVAATGA